MCQALLPKAAGDGRVMALEILIPNAAIRNLIREDKIHQIYSMMQTGQDKFGMQTFNQALATLVPKADHARSRDGAVQKRGRIDGNDQPRARVCCPGQRRREQRWREARLHPSVKGGAAPSL